MSTRYAHEMDRPAGIAGWMFRRAQSWLAGKAGILCQWGALSVLSLALLASPARGQSRPLKIVLIATSSALIVEDCFQTIYFTQRGFSELNPLNGRHPTPARLMGACAVGLVANAWPWKLRSVVNVAVIVAEMYVVVSNINVREHGRSLHVGIRFTP